MVLVCPKVVERFRSSSSRRSASAFCSDPRQRTGSPSRHGVRSRLVRATSNNHPPATWKVWARRSIPSVGSGPRSTRQFEPHVLAGCFPEAAGVCLFWLPRRLRARTDRDQFRGQHAVPVRMLEDATTRDILLFNAQNELVGTLPPPGRLQLAGRGDAAISLAIPRRPVHGRAAAAAGVARSCPASASRSTSSGTNDLAAWCTYPAEAEVGRLGLREPETIRRADTVRLHAVDRRQRERHHFHRHPPCPTASP